jgi:alkyl hydroperoxide reductase subunit AhpC
MAIYAMTGTKVKVVGGDFSKGEVDVIGYGRNPDEVKEVWVHQLRADNGLTEIENAISEATA